MTAPAIWVCYNAYCINSVLTCGNIAEEVQNASVNVPRAMIFTIFINGALGFATYLVILYCFGNPESTLTTPYGFPFIQIFFNATQSVAGTTVMISILIIMYVSATFGFLASASRQAWAFARDNGLPFSRHLKKVSLISPDFSYRIYADCLPHLRLTSALLFHFGPSP